MWVQFFVFDSGFCFGLQDSGLSMHDFGFGVPDAGFRVQDFCFLASGFSFWGTFVALRFQDFGFRV